MNYIVVIAYKQEDIERLVNERISEGYICQGGICVAHTPSISKYYQAMIKVS